MGYTKDNLISEVTVSNKVKIIVVAILMAGGAYVLLNKNDTDQVNNTNQTTQTTNKTDTTTKPVEQPKTEVSTIDGAIAKLKKAGLTVSEKQGAYFQVVGAKNGDKVDVDGTNVEMYEFSTEQKAKEAVTQLKSDDNTTYAKNTFVVLIHSTDQAFVSKIQKIL